MNLTSGSRGDVQPYVALGSGRQAGGQAMTFIAQHLVGSAAATGQRLSGKQRRLCGLSF